MYYILFFAYLFAYNQLVILRPVVFVVSSIKVHRYYPMADFNTTLNAYTYAVYVYDFSPDPNNALSQSGGNLDIYGSEGGFLQFRDQCSKTFCSIDCNKIGIEHFRGKRQIILIYSLRGRITVQLTSCFNCFDSYFYVQWTTDFLVWSDPNQ